MAVQRNIFQQLSWATTYFLLFLVGHKANILICLVKSLKTIYLLLGCYSDTCA